MIIDCGTCARAAEREAADSACGDCVVSVLLGPPVVEVSADHAAAMAVLADAGLVPPLRLVPSLPDQPVDPLPVRRPSRRRRAG